MFTLAISLQHFVVIFIQNTGQGKAVNSFLHWKGIKLYLQMTWHQCTEKYDYKEKTSVVRQHKINVHTSCLSVFCNNQI
jgi:hypothetical protein